jgi:putative acetyltransferase
MNIEIQPADSSDLRAVHDVHVQAFNGRQDEAKLVDLLHAANKASPSLVAMDGGRVVAHVVFSPMSFAPDRPGLRVVGLGPVAVLPDRQRRGIGTRLINAGIELCRENGVEAIAVLGGPKFYARFGFQPAKHFGLTSVYGDSHFMLLELKPGALANVTGLVNYAPEFAAAGC